MNSWTTKKSLNLHNPSPDISIYITTKTDSNEQLDMLKTSIKYAHNYYPNNEIVLINDNSKIPLFKNMFEHKNLRIVDSEFHGAGEALRLYYFWKLHTSKWAICVHDSQFINSEFNMPPEGYPYQWLFEAKHINDAPILEINLLTLLGDPKLTEFYNKEKLSWKVAFGVQCIVEWDFINKVANKFPNLFKEFISSIKVRHDRMCIERLMSVIFAYVHPAPESMFGDIFVFTDRASGGEKEWGVTYKEYLENKDEYDIYPTIKVWVGR